MEVIYNIYQPDDEIPVHAFTRHQKLVKYYTRETMAAIVTLGQWIERGINLPHNISFFYSSGETEMISDYTKAFDVLLQMEGRFSPVRYIEEVLPCISPVTQFKMMRNMTHCLVAIEYGLKGDNATFLCASATDLLHMALLADKHLPVLIGEGRLALNGLVEIGFALLQPSEIDKLFPLEKGDENRLFFKEHAQYTNLCQSLLPE